MRAVVIEDVGKVTVRDVPDPTPRAQALIEVESAGLCGTDLKILSGGIPVKFPLVPGHEIVGRIVAPGPRQLYPVGTRVLVDPGEECGRCKMCRADKGYLCPNGLLRGRDVDGGFAQLMAVDEMRLHPLPDSLSAEDTGPLQVLATCIHAQSLVASDPGQTAVVVGLGVAGLMHVQLLRNRGINRVIAVTRSAWKQELALRLGASAVATPDEVEAVVAEQTDGQGADLVVESAGAPATLRQAIDVTGPGGTVLVFGIVSGTADLTPYRWYFNELSIINSRAARPRDYDAAVQAAADGVVQLSPVVTSSYSLDDAVDAFNACRSGGELKVMLRMR
jgi:2-desacetyl-2-hydroxyethyl bacteriochlorophyllide A dehydrogenase